MSSILRTWLAIGLLSLSTVLPSLGRYIVGVTRALCNCAVFAGRLFCCPDWRRIDGVFSRFSGTFDVTAYPVVTFRSTGVRQKGSDRATIEGALTARGVTHRETFEATLVTRPQPVPGVPRWEATTARNVHILLLAPTVIVPLAGGPSPRRLL